jgi:predicted  nucleic acid-binding Zn-ribbon protein
LYRPAIAAFHTGLRPNEYYKAKSKKTIAEDRLAELRNDRGVVNRVLDKIETLMKDSQFDMSIENYQKEVSLLLARCNELRLNEDALRDQMVQIENRRVLVNRQIEIAESAATELGKDFAFAAEQLEDDVECPTCGAHYENSFAERFGIAADEDNIRSLLVQLIDEREDCDAELQNKQEMVTEVKQRLAEIRELLEAQQGEVRLQDVLQSEGKKEVRMVLRSEVDDLNREIGEIDDTIMEAEREMRSLTAPKRTKEIKEYYQGRMSVHLQMLNVTELAEESYKEVHSRIKESGSDGPRALLAFYFAILKTIEKYSTTTLCPIVIDSPNQQDQDHENWKKMLEFMRDQRPPEAQMIIGLVDDMGIDLGGDIIELTDDRQLLQKSEYDEVAKLIRPFIDKSLAQ